jgi:hypothetical protein
MLTIGATIFGIYSLGSLILEGLDHLHRKQKIQKLEDLVNSEEEIRRDIEELENKFCNLSSLQAPLSSEQRLLLLEYRELSRRYFQFMKTVEERNLQDNKEVMSAIQELNKMEDNDWFINGIENSSLYDEMKSISDKLRVQERMLKIE